MLGTLSPAHPVWEVERAGPPKTAHLRSWEGFPIRAQRCPEACVLFFSCVLADCSSQWLSQKRICSTQMTPDSLQELSPSHLAAPDSPND